MHFHLQCNLKTIPWNFNIPHYCAIRFLRNERHQQADKIYQTRGGQTFSTEDHIEDILLPLGAAWSYYTYYIYNRFENLKIRFT